MAEQQINSKKQHCRTDVQLFMPICIQEHLYLLYVIAKQVSLNVSPSISYAINRNRNKLSQNNCILIVFLCVCVCVCMCVGVSVCVRIMHFFLIKREIL